MCMVLELHDGFRKLPAACEFFPFAPLVGPRIAGSLTITGLIHIHLLITIDWSQTWVHAPR
jgi:hypothetical protein